MAILFPLGWFSGVTTPIGTAVRDDDMEDKDWGLQKPYQSA
jgi:hypothetical protein